MERRWDDDVDARGLRCPLPVLRARKRLMALPVGGVLRLRTDDPMAVIDVPHFCAQAGHTVLESREMASAHLFLLRKGDGQQADGHHADASDA